MGALIRYPWSWTRSAPVRPNEAAAAAVDDPRIGPHCTDMPTDSQRGSSVRSAGPADGWLAPVLVAKGVLTPRQAEALEATTDASVWDATLSAGATDATIVAAV